MDKSTADITKRKRPPAAGEPILVRLQPDLLASVDAIASFYSVSRPEAVRKIITEWQEAGL